jgi:hypothetical protein
MTRKPNFRRQIQNILLGFALLGLMLFITAHIDGDGDGFYWLVVLTRQAYYPIVMLGIWCGTTYLLFNDKLQKNPPKPRKSLLLSALRYLAIPPLALLLLFYGLTIGIALVIPIPRFQHCDTVQTKTATYHLDLRKTPVVAGFQHTYYLTQCKHWQMCQVIARAVDEDALSGETLHIQGNSIFATAANRPDEPITWMGHGQAGRFIKIIDRLPIENP